MLASEFFSRAPALSRFLTYVCEQAFEGKAESLKEYSIAVEAFGRSETFDHTKDSIVRVEAHKLRQRLKNYYATLGPQHGVYIEVPAGQYAPVFRLVAEGVDEKIVTRTAAGVQPRAPQLALSPLPSIEVVRPVRRAWLVGGVLSGALILGFVFLPGPDWRFRAAPAPAALGVAADPIYRIAAGSGPNARYVDELGRTWNGDAYFEGGQPAASPDSLIEHTPSPDLYRSWREGEFRYVLPADPGVYELRLHFAEVEFGPGNPSRAGESERLFDIGFNGREPAFTSFDVLSTAGGPNQPVELVIPGLEPNPEGAIEVRFTRDKGEPMLAGVELFRGLPDKALPVRLLCGRSTEFRNDGGAQWSADRYFQGGRSVPRSNPISATDNPNVYAAERYGNFRYRIPVALGGRYTVRLHFVEQWWGETNHGGGGAGSRLFDVYCNGVALVRGLDVYAEAGGENRVLVKTFPALEPNPQGVLDLSFVPTVNYALVNAIEVLAE